MNLTTSHKLFIQRMTENEEQEQKGYELLLKKDFFAEFFDALSAAGLFASERSPGLIPAKEEGYVKIPYWSALDYLEACARYSGEHNDINLANKVLEIVRAVSALKEADGSPRQNYHTTRKFAEILGLVPTSTVNLGDIDLVPLWLSDRFDRGLVSNALDKGPISNFLKSTNPDDWKKALKILSYCTALVKSDKKDELLTIVDDYWLKDLINNQAKVFGEKLGGQAADVFLQRLEDVFGAGTRSNLSYLFRPAVEDHPQNHQWHGPENRFVEGLRDILLAWLDSGNTDSKEYIAQLLISKLEIARRVAIHIVDERWMTLNDLFINQITPDLFQSGHLHEMYRLLNRHFAGMDNALRDKILDAIAKLPVPKNVEDKDYYLKSMQRKWLSAITDKGCEAVDKWYADLNAELKTTLLDHPDFHSYVESSWGNGSSPYPVQTLLQLAKDLSLIQKLNEFKQTDRWRGPTTHALVDALTEAVTLEPETFINIIDEFLLADRPYQYGVIAGLKRVWDKDKTEKGTIDWDAAWTKIFIFLEELLTKDEFWQEAVVNDEGWSPNRDWIPPIIADLIRSGTNDDAHAFVACLFPKAKCILQLMLEKAKSVENLEKDAMNQAINSTKGKVIEAWLSFSLRVCRNAKKQNGNFVQEWESLQPTFDQETEKCVNSNFEFSTLAASYFAQFEFMSFTWLATNITKLFPLEHQENFKASISGLAYSQPTRAGYKLLIDAGVIDHALRTYNEKKEFEERLVERVALAYLWGDESLDSPRFKYFFETPDIDSLEIISRFFWSISAQELKPNEIETILKFWVKCVEWAISQKQLPAALLSNLSTFICYLDKIDELEKGLLMITSQYANVNYNADRLIEHLDRLADVSPQAVRDILEKLLSVFQPTFDFEDHLKSIMKKLATQGLRIDALALVDNLRRLRGMPELYEELQHQ